MLPKSRLVLSTSRHSLNRAPSYENLIGIQRSKSLKLAKPQQKAQRLFDSCSDFLNQRLSKESLHRDLENYDKFLGKVKDEYSESSKKPPIVLRSHDGLQEEQFAIYQMRTNHETKYYNQTIDYRNQNTKRQMTKRFQQDKSKMKKQSEASDRKEIVEK